MLNLQDSLLQDLMAKVIKDTPEEPIPYLIKVLKKVYSEGGPKVHMLIFIN